MEITTHHYRLASQLAARVRSAAFVAEEKWGSMIGLSGAFFDNESVQGGAIALSLCAVTVPGELVRIDDYALDDVDMRLFLQESLTREVEPFIIGVGEVRVIRKEPFDGLIVVRAGGEDAKTRKTQPLVGTGPGFEPTLLKNSTEG